MQELKPVYKLSGQNNKIFIIENGTEREITYSEKVAGIEIKIQGNNNRVYLELPIKAVGSTITIDNRNYHAQCGDTGDGKCGYQNRSGMYVFCKSIYLRV